MSQPPPLPADAKAAPQALEPHVRQIVAIAELLLAAAHADGTVAWSERSAIASVLAGFVGESDLPAIVHERMEKFEFKSFDLEAACKQLSLTDADDRANLLGLIARVTDADAVLKIGERSYLKRVAKAIGASDEELEPFIVGDPEKVAPPKTKPLVIPTKRSKKKR